MNYGMWDISQLLEQWACTKLKGNRTISMLSAMQKECSSIINGTLSKSVILDIYLPFNWSYMTEMVSNSKQALMNYTNYDAKVIDWYHMKLMGWTFCEFKSPFDIHTIDNVCLLLEALQSGSCFWMWMSKNEVHHHKIDVKEESSQKNNRESKGTKVRERYQRPHQKAPGVGKGDKNDAPPAKKQKKGKSKKGDDAPLVKKQKKGVSNNTKKLKWTWFPPACPTSNVFIVSDDDEV